MEIHSFQRKGIIKNQIIAEGIKVIYLFIVDNYKLAFIGNSSKKFQNPLQRLEVYNDYN